ncbi:MAG: aminotransferase class V-fold PLP-dependent enzyme [Nitrospinota bacterium]
MHEQPPLKFKIASEQWEFEQIHRLNYRVFVDEIPRHGPNPTRALVDKFHPENVYVICLCGGRVVGMVAIRSKRPFSLDEKLENLDSYLPHGRSPCEVRLLAVEKNHRSGLIFSGLLKLLALHCKKQGYDLGVISGTLRQQKLYKHLGFVPFGPVIGSPEARFQPMYITSETFRERTEAILRRLRTVCMEQTLVNLSPGPVGISQGVRQVYGKVPISHRSDAFMRDFRQTQRLLCRLVGSRSVEIFFGSGTLANDVIAGQLSLLPGRGLILSNGEFGDRLIHHAQGFRLPFEIVAVEWGDTFDEGDIERVMDRNPDIGWLWAVHCETSTGVLNNMTMLKIICAEREIRLCMDCVSSIGTVPIDLDGIYLAAGVSGKGIGAFPGLSFVFYNHDVPPAPNGLPRYLDLGLYASRDGVPFTLSSNLLYALQAALERFQTMKPFKDIADLSIWLRPRLRGMSLHLVASDAQASPAVMTIALPTRTSSEDLGRRLEERGYLLSYKSGYLLERNWIQISLMGECSRRRITPLLRILKDFTYTRPVGNVTSCDGVGG